MKSVLTDGDIDATPLDITARIDGRTHREILVALAREALDHAEDAAHWMRMFVSDGAGTSAMEPQPPLDDTDRDRLLLAVTAASGHAAQLATAVRAYSGDRPGWDPLKPARRH
jgi:hypothetical protein